MNVFAFALIIVIVLGSIAALTGFNIFKLIAYLKEELLTVLGTSSSESALVPLMAWVIFKEPASWKFAVGYGLMLAGFLVILQGKA